LTSRRVNGTIEDESVSSAVISLVRSLRTLAVAALIAGGAAYSFAAAQQEQTAAIRGKAKEVAKPYERYSIRARNAESGQLIAEMPLDDKAQYLFPNLPVPAPYLIELYDKMMDSVLCTEGPVITSAPSNLRRSVDISCKKPLAAWKIIAPAVAAGVTAGIIAVVQASSSQ
jgi:hypothetical protein